MKLLLTFFVLAGLVNCDSQRPEPSPQNGNTLAQNSNVNAANTNANARTYALDESVPPITKEVEVPADVMWYDTGVNLEDGKKFMIQAKGEWSFGKALVGPLGEIGVMRRDALFPAGDIGTLIGKVGDEVFYIGDRIEMPGGPGGRLFLSINDQPDSFRNNKGKMHVFITFPEPFGH